MYYSSEERRTARTALAKISDGPVWGLLFRDPNDVERETLLQAWSSHWHVRNTEMNEDALRALKVHTVLHAELTPARARRMARDGVAYFPGQLVAAFEVARAVGDTDAGLVLKAVAAKEGVELPELRSPELISAQEKQANAQWQTGNFPELTATRLAAHQDVQRALAAQLSVDVNAMKIGGWPCAYSPVSTCVYDLTSEMGDDECLICHDPSERK